MQDLQSVYNSDVCCIKGCDSVVLAAGLCSKHWKRNKLYGSPVLLRLPNIAYKGMPTLDRFYTRVEKHEGGCWIWTGGTDSDGYGLFDGDVAGVKHRRAHRFSIHYFKGVEPIKGMNVCHSCDNPSCVNPDHLSLGTPKENQAQKWQRGRANVLKGENAPRAKLTAKMVDEIRSAIARGEKLFLIARDFGVTAGTVSDIKRGKSWKG